jgi:hypothetical protein
MGGDEFVALYTGPSDKDILDRMANQLVSIFSQPIYVDPYTFRFYQGEDEAGEPQYLEVIVPVD